MYAFEDLEAASGPEIIQSFIGAEETLHLEFKILSQTKGASIGRDDRVLVAKALTGLANAEGGMLILGIQTATVDGIDVATAIKPISEIAGLRNKLISLMPELLSPPHDGLKLAALAESDGSGYIAIHVPPSSRRPHMCVTDHRYYRRGSQGTRVMEHGEIRDLMFAPRSSELALTYHLRPAGSEGYCFFYVLKIGLRNNGSAPASLPYLAICHLVTRVCGENVKLLNQRDLQDGYSGFFGSRDAVIHIDQELHFCELDVGLDLSQGREHFTPEYYLQYAIDNNQLELLQVSAMPWRPNGQVIDRPMKLPCYFGAENAPRQSGSVSFTKRRLLREMMAITPAFFSSGLELED